MPDTLGAAAQLAALLRAAPSPNERVGLGRPRRAGEASGVDGAAALYPLACSETDEYGRRLVVGAGADRR
jgi:hypothetical protein